MSDATDRTATSTPILGHCQLDALAELDGQLLILAAALGAELRQYPVLIRQSALSQAEYHQAFPHLLLSAAPLANPAAVAVGESPAYELATPKWCLSPAVCYHVYQEFQDQQLSRPLVVTARGRCFRNESTTFQGTRQLEFEMREIVWVGCRAWIDEQLSAGCERLTELAHSLGLFGDWVVAEDPFFLPAAQGKAFVQRLQETKREYQTRDPERVALASSNRHGTFFGERFRIMDRDGQTVHTACLAIGLDRWLFRLASPERK